MYYNNASHIYDGVGNLTSHNRTASYDAKNRLASVSGSRAGSYTYDAYGDILTGPGSSYTWDGVPNLRCVNCADTANKVVEYIYLGGKRVAQREITQ